MIDMFIRTIQIATLLTTTLTCMGCSGSWHDKFNWKAENYFDDPQVIALCDAIEADDVAEIDRLIKSGADINAKGKDNMTPLLWAYPDNKLERFKKLLEHGADPNVIVGSDFDTRGGIAPGYSVTDMASMTWFPGYFEAVFTNGGDPHLVKTARVGKGDTPLFSLIIGHAPDKTSKIKMLTDKGVDLNHLNGSGGTPTMQAVGWMGQFDLALAMLEAGADHRIYQANQVYRLVHVVVLQERRLPSFSPQQRTDYQKLVKWLEDHGESIEEARADFKRWDSWSRTSGEYRRNMDREIAERKAREQREKSDKESTEK